MKIHRVLVMHVNGRWHPASGFYSTLDLATQHRKRLESMFAPNIWATLGLMHEKGRCFVMVETVTVYDALPE